MAGDGTWISPADLDEERLMVERAKRSAEGFGDLYARYSDRVYAYAYKRTRNREDAEDITSNTFVLALENIGKYEWRNLPFSAWLFRIASSQIAAHYRKSQPCLPIDDLTICDSGAGPEEAALRTSDAQEVQQALSWLTADQQRAMRLRYHDGMRAREIATQMGRTEGSVRLILHRATHSLRAQMLPLSA